MDIELLEFKKNFFAEDKKLGEALIEVKGKMKMWFRIVRGKDGRVFAFPPSIKIDDKYEPVFTLSSNHAQHGFCKEVLELVIKEKKIEV